MEQLSGVLDLFGSLISKLVGSIAEFFLGPLPKFLLRLGIPYVCIFGVLAVINIIFRLTGFLVFIGIVDIAIAAGLILFLLLLSVLFKKGGHHYDTYE